MMIKLAFYPYFSNHFGRNSGSLTENKRMNSSSVLDYLTVFFSEIAKKIILILER